jgi:DHA3 family tetracycline resistance protein-like MFS transporter
LDRLPALRVYLILAASRAGCFALFSTFSSIYRIRTAGLDPLELVLVGTVLELSVFLLEIPTGVVADVYSRRLSVGIGYALIGVGFVFESLHPTFGAILLAQVIWGAGYTFTSGAGEAWIVDELGSDDIGPVFLRGTQIGQLGALLAMGLSAALASVGLWLPLFCAGIGYLLLAGFVAVAMPEQGFTRRPVAERQGWRDLAQTLRDGTGVVRARPALLWLLGIALFLGLSSEPLDRLWELHLLSFELPALGPADPIVWFGILNAAALLLGIAATAWLRRRANLASERSALRLLLALNAGLVVAIAGFALAGSFAVAVLAWWGMTVLRRTSAPVLATWANRQIPSGVRATVLSMQTQSDSLGQFIGGPALGGLARAATLRAAFLACAALLLPVQALYSRAARRGERSLEDRTARR